MLCDAHVHIYPCFNLSGFLASAWNNFRDAARQHGETSRFSAALLLTETMRDHWFSKMSDAARAGRSLCAGWEFHETGEPDSVRVHGPEGREILAIAGRQIITAENLEILALATAAERPDGHPIAAVVEWVLETGGIPVIPWGFGKWWGGRGKILSRLLDSYQPDQVFLGDNSGRPRFLVKPRQFTAAEREKRPILPGSDPLPFPSEARRPGSVGFFYDAAPGTPASAQAIRDRLLTPNRKIGTYMHCERLFPFVHNQIGMQWRKRMR
jgi:hypothetical protein